jgi:hypothetical protein
LSMQRIEPFGEVHPASSVQTLYLSPLAISRHS